MDASTILIHPLNTESAMKKVRKPALGYLDNILTSRRSRRTTPSSSLSMLRPTSARSPLLLRSSTTFLASRSTPSSAPTAPRRLSPASPPMSMLSTSPPPSLTLFKRILVYRMEWTWDTQLEKAMCYAWRSWARSHGDSNETIQHNATISVRDLQMIPLHNLT
jgi:hypothetical protein